MRIKSSLLENDFQELKREDIEVLGTGGSLFPPFGQGIKDYVEIHIYDDAGNLLYSDEDFQDYTLGALAIGSLSEELNLDPVAILNSKGFTYGKYNVAINIQRRKLFNTPENVFSVKESWNANRGVR